MIIPIIYNYLLDFFAMNVVLKPAKTLGVSLLIASAFITQPVFANGPIGEHVNHLQDNLKNYNQDVEWMSACQFCESNKSMLAHAAAQANGFPINVGPCISTPAWPSLIPVAILSLVRVAEAS